jgi:hypothetical protein
VHPNELSETEREQLRNWIEFKHSTWYVPLILDTPNRMLDSLIDMRRYYNANPPVRIKLREKYTEGTKIPFVFAVQTK